MKGFVYLFISVSLLTSCGNKSVDAIPMEESEAEADIVVVGDTSVLKFVDVDVYLTGLQIGSLTEALKIDREVKGDSVEIQLDLGQSLDQAHIYVCKKETQQTISVDMYESQVNVLSIQNEGPHLDLGEWQTYVSAYTSIEPLGNDHYRPLAVDYENLKFDPINYVALIKHVDSLDGPDKSWVTLLKQMKQHFTESAAPEYPVSVGIGQRWIRIEGKGGKGFTKWLKFTLPQGC